MGKKITDKYIHLFYSLDFLIKKLYPGDYSNNDCLTLEHMILNTKREREGNAIVGIMVYEHKIEGLMVYCSHKKTVPESSSLFFNHNLDIIKITH